MTEKSFIDLYQEARKQPTAAQLFVSRVAKLTHRSEITVRMWLTGSQTPDELVQATIAKEFDMEPSALFPNSNKDRRHG